jgi:hypothetical protein
MLIVFNQFEEIIVRLQAGQVAHDNALKVGGIDTSRHGRNRVRKTDDSVT